MGRKPTAREQRSQSWKWRRVYSRSGHTAYGVWYWKRGGWSLGALAGGVMLYTRGIVLYYT